MPDLRREMSTLKTWTLRHWMAAASVSIATAVAVAIPTAIIPTPFFTRSMSVTWWSYPVVIATGVLAGLLAGSYVRSTSTGIVDQLEPGPTRMGFIGGLLTFFAVGCPVCNKIVVIAIGASGAMTWFAPVQPALAIASLVFMVVAVRTRLLNQYRCTLPRVAA